MRGIAGDKRRNGRRKTYVEIGNWQVSRSYEENDRKKTRGQEEKGPTQVKETSCLVGFRRKTSVPKETGIRKQLEILKTLLTYKPSRYIICNIVTYKISRN